MNKEDAWISVSERLPPAGTGPVLVMHLKPYMGILISAMEIAMYDGPEGYSDVKCAEGWIFANIDRKVMRVTHWRLQPEEPDCPLFEMNQKEYLQQYEEHLGSVRKRNVQSENPD